MKMTRHELTLKLFNLGILIEEGALAVLTAKQYRRVEKYVLDCAQPIPRKGRRIVLPEPLQRMIVKVSPRKLPEPRWKQQQECRIIWKLSEAIAAKE